MACVAVTSLVRTLELEFLQPQPRPIVLDNELISGNKELIESLGEKLEFMMEQFDEKSMDGVEAIKNLETKLRDVAFRVEDEIEFQVVDLYVKKLQRDTDEEKIHHCLRLRQIFHRAVEKIRPCLRLRHILQRAIEDIDHIEEELVKVKNEYEHVIDVQGRTTVDVLLKSDEVIVMGASCQLASNSEDIMVGKNNEFKTIKEMLIKHPFKQREIVSIKGMGGIGKTTLARQTYDDPSIASHFDKRAWVVISQHHNKRQVLKGLLNSMGNAESSKDEELELQLYQGLKGLRYLVVMDDVWSREAWDDVKACFPDDGNGSRILLTTRLNDVASYASSDNGFSHQMQLLDQSESLNLFCEKVLLKGIYHSDEFEMIGRPIVEKCRGLPLAIVVVAGLFSKLNTLDEWKNIAKALNSFATTTIAEACSRILSLSYNHLPHKLKACFLYLGVFPKDEEIHANNLARLWAAEGLVKAFKNKSFEVMAERHIQELKDRNLILVSKQSSNGRKIKTFKMHNLLHAFCVREAQNENLLNVVDQNDFNFHQKDFRWGSIVQCSEFNIPAFFSSSKNCRSIFCFPNYGAPPYLNLQKFNILRVLYVPDASASAWVKAPHKVGCSVHLRYISSSIVQISNSKPFSPWNLQTLHARSDSYSLEDFPQLCYYRDWISWPYPPKFVHQNLQSFSGLSLSHCTKELFTNIPSLKKVCIAKRNESAVDCIGCIENLANLQQLQSLKICDYYDGFKYPINKQIALLKDLKKLSIFSKGFRWKEINVLSTLPKLEVLKLGGYACQGRKWKLRADETFCQLLFLKFDLLDLKHWEISGDHFPKLESLLLCNCSLKEIPSSFVDISTLKSIELRRCLPSAVTSAKQIQEEQHKYGNNDMVVIEKDTQLERRRGFRAL